MQDSAADYGDCYRTGTSRACRQAKKNQPEVNRTMPNITVFDVAGLAGVSIKTVSRVVNNEPFVRPSTKERVDKAIAELNYVPDESARFLASHRGQRSR